MITRNEEHALRRVLRTDIPGKIIRKNACRDMKNTGLRAGEEVDRAMWSRKSYLATL